MDCDTAKRAVVRVGGGRGFIVQSGHDRLIITGAHCLPDLPPPRGGSYIEERTFANLIGPIGSEPTVWAECLFADPIADIAVLGAPDGQGLNDKWEAYEDLTDTLEPLAISILPSTFSRPPITFPAWLLSLSGEWFPCIVEHGRRGLLITRAAALIDSGMSGSPILSEDGGAIGIMCIDHAANPNLSLHLSAGLLHRLTT